jgi:hypothetical protein
VRTGEISRVRLLFVGSRHAFDVDLAGPRLHLSGQEREGLEQRMTDELVG